MVDYKSLSKLIRNEIQKAISLESCAEYLAESLAESNECTIRGVLTNLSSVNNKDKDAEVEITIFVNIKNKNP